MHLCKSNFVSFRVWASFNANFICEQLTVFKKCPPPTGISTPNTAPPPSSLVLLMYNDTPEYSFEGLQ